MDFETFREQELIGRYADWVRNDVGGAFNGRGWTELLGRYRWSGYGPDLTLESRRRQGAALAEAATAAEWEAAVNFVREWGRIRKPLTAGELQELRDACDLLATEPGAEKFFARRIALASKVYAARYPDRWIVYDSRIGLRLACLVRRWWDDLGDDAGALWLRFPVPPGETRVELPKGFVGQTTDDQMRPGFIYSSWLCRLLAQQLDEAGVALPDVHGLPPIWTAQLVEMALFTKSD